MRRSLAIVAWCGLGCGLFEERIPDLFPDSVEAVEATTPAPVLCVSVDCEPCSLEAGCGVGQPSDEELAPTASRAADAGTDLPGSLEPEPTVFDPKPVEPPAPAPIGLDPEPSSVDAGLAPVAPAEPTPPSGPLEPDAGMEPEPGPRPPPPPRPRRQ